MSESPAEPAFRPSRACFAAMVAVTALAATLRFYNLGFGFFGDEFSLLDSVTSMRVTEPNWPLMFWISQGVGKLIGVSEWKMRLAPAVLGVAAIPALYFAGRRVFGELAMVLACLLIAVSHWHLFHSQSARFYPAVFLFSGLALCWVARTIVTGQVRFALAAALAVAIAAGFHPTGIWPAVGFGAFCVPALVAPAVRGRLNWKVVLAFFGPLALGGLVFIGSIIRTSSFIAGTLDWGYSPAHIFLGWARALGIPLLAVAGCWLLWLLRSDRPKGWYFLITGLLPLLVMMAFSLFKPVRPDYVFAVAPLWFFLAGGAAAAVAAAVNVPLAARAGFILALLVSELPSTVSHHLENRTLDPRIAYQFVKDHRQPGDLIFHNFVPMLHYYTGLNYHSTPTAKKGQLVSDPDKLLPNLAEAEAGNKTTWFLIRSTRGGIDNQALADWLTRHAKLAAHYDAKRIDYEVSAISVYRYDPPQQQRESTLKQQATEKSDGK